MAQPSAAAAATLLPSTTSLSWVECHGKANGNFPNQNLPTTTNTIPRFESTNRPSLVNSFPFPCHSVLPSSSRRSQRISRPSISIAVVPPINKISLWPWEPTPLSISSCSAIFYPFDIEIWIESTSSSSSAASSPPFTACLSSSFPRARIRKIEF